MIRHAVGHIFDAIQQDHGKQFLIRASYLEIYNEKVTDLLAEAKDRKKNLKVLDDNQGNVSIENLREIQILSKEQIFQAMADGENCRSYGTTNMNERSSR